MSSILRLISRRIAPASRRLLSPPTKSFSTATAAHRELLRRPSPWLMLPPSFLAGGGNMVYNFYSPIDGRVVSCNNRGGKEETELMRDQLTNLMGSSHGWLALFNSGSRRMFLSNPISGRRVELPPLLTGETITVEADMRCPRKVIISSSPEEKDCRALVILGSANRVAYCNPGRGDEEWTPLGRWNEDPIGIHNIGKYRIHRDFVHSAARKRFFGFSVSACCQEEELEEWDMTGRSGPRRVRLNRLGKDDRELESRYLCSTYLVCGEPSDQLFTVRSYFLPEGTVDFDVYRNDDCGRLKLCSSLDDLAMFVGINHSFAVKASKFPGLKPNCIYFSDSKMSNHDGQFIGIFNYQTKTCSPLYYDSLKQQDLTPQPWFTPTLN